MKWITKTEKYTRYKIFHDYNYNPTLKEKMYRGNLFFIYEYSDKLIFKLYSYKTTDDLDPTITNKVGILKYKNGQFNFYTLHGDKFLNCSNSANHASNMWLTTKIRKAIHTKRIRSVVYKFAKKHGVTNLKKEKADLMMLKLCYPALRNVKDDICIYKISSGLTRTFRKKNSIEDVIKSVFKKNAENVLQLFNKTKAINTLNYAILLKKIDLIDEINEITNLLTTSEIQDIEENTKVYIDVFQNYDKETIKKLFKVPRDKYEIQNLGHCVKSYVHRNKNIKYIFPSNPKSFSEILESLRKQFYDYYRQPRNMVVIDDLALEA